MERKLQMKLRKSKLLWMDKWLEDEGGRVRKYYVHMLLAKATYKGETRGQGQQK